MTSTKNALITGASRGLGRALARSLAADGWSLVIDAREEAPLFALAEELAASTTVTAVPGDVGQEEHLRALVEAARAMGGLDLLVHNASRLGPAIGQALPPLDDYPIAALEAVYRVNVFAPLRLTQLAVSLLRPGARLIAITSDAAVEAYAGWGGYGSSKAALEQVSRVLAAEHPEWRVYWVDPGDMNTRMQQEAFPGQDVSDRPPPEASVPGLRRLIDADLPSGRYQARALTPLEVS